MDTPMSNLGSPLSPTSPTGNLEPSAPHNVTPTLPVGGDANPSTADERPDEGTPVVPDADNEDNSEHHHEYPANTPSTPIVEATDATANSVREQVSRPPSPVATQPGDTQPPHGHIIDNQSATVPPAEPTPSINETAVLPDDSQPPPDNIIDDQGATAPPGTPNLPTEGPGDTSGSGPRGPAGIQVPKPELESSNPHKLLATGSTVQTAQLTGWPAVEKALTEFDRQEIAAYKEDLDSLLTFTGLYSAVLTAFVIVSYPQLQEDTAGETLQVLRLIAAQTATYTILDGRFASSTAVIPTTTAPFQPSTSAIRVNVLWFASLVISLAVASLSILVKQWLRAYMAFASASPQGQLRIRHFRRSGMDMWKVLEIASMLPLLLQISLALFFIGLCMFTFGVHPAIGNTTLPLVCAWAFLLIVVTISPIFSSRCPYKTPALLGAISALRNDVYPVVLKILLIRVPYVITYALSLVFVRFAKTAEQLRTSEPFKPLTQEVDQLKNGDWDLQILAAADAVQADDNLLDTTIVEALSKSSSDWASITEFLVRVIGNRVLLPGSNDPRKQPPLISVSRVLSLSNSARSAIAKIFRIHVIPELLKEQVSNPDRPGDATMKRWSAYIFAECNRNGTQFLVDILQDVGWDLTILASADAFLADDGPFLKTVQQLLERSGTKFSWIPVMEFLVRIIRTRVPSEASDDPSSNETISRARYQSLAGTIREVISAIFKGHVVPGVLDQWVLDPDRALPHDTKTLKTYKRFGNMFDAIVYGERAHVRALATTVLQDGYLNLEDLAEVDAFLIDDSVLVNTAVELLRRSDQELDWMLVAEFLVRVLGHRLPLEGSNNPLEALPLTSIPDYDSLSNALKSTVASIFKSRVVSRLFKSKSNRSRGAAWAAAGWSACIFSAAYNLSARIELLMDILRGEQWDIAILAEADALLADDKLLVMTVTEVLKQNDRKLDWTSATESLVRLVGNRIAGWDGSDDPRNNPAPPMQSLYDGTLPDPVRASITQLFGFYIIPGMLKQQDLNPDWFNEPTLRILSGWSVCMFNEIHDDKKQDRLFNPQDLFYRWLAELARSPREARNFFEVSWPEPLELQPSIDLVKVLMWCERKGSVDSSGTVSPEIISTILAIVTLQEGRLKLWNSYLASKVAQVLLPMLDASPNLNDDLPTYTDGAILTIKLCCHINLFGLDLTKYFKGIFLRLCLHYLVLLQRHMEDAITRLRGRQGLSALSSSDLEAFVQQMRRLGLVCMQTIFLATLYLDPSSIREFTRRMKRVYDSSQDRMLVMNAITMTVAATRPDSSRLRVLNLSLLAIELLDFGTALAESEASQRKLIFHLLGFLLECQPSSGNQDAERQVLSYIYKVLPTCTDRFEHSRFGCPEDASFLPDYFYLSLSLIANEQLSIIPHSQSRSIFISNMTIDEQYDIRVKAAQEVATAISYFNSMATDEQNSIGGRAVRDMVVAIMKRAVERRSNRERFDTDTSAT